MLCPYLNVGDCPAGSEIQLSTFGRTGLVQHPDGFSLATVHIPCNIHLLGSNQWLDSVFAQAFCPPSNQVLLQLPVTKNMQTALFATQGPARCAASGIHLPLAALPCMLCRRCPQTMLLAFYVCCCRSASGRWQALADLCFVSVFVAHNFKATRAPLPNAACSQARARYELHLVSSPLAACEPLCGQPLYSAA